MNVDGTECHKWFGDCLHFDTSQLNSQILFRWHKVISFQLVFNFSKQFNEVIKC